jgi:two-component system response regulator RstA
MILGVNEIDACILLVEDDAPLAAMIAEYLSGHGFRVGIEPRGDTAVARILAEKPDLVILDLALPGEDGLTICRRLRPAFSQPILMLTARGDDTDEVVGLELGADDYLAKPVRPRVLLARVRALLRRPETASLGQDVITAGDVVVDPATRVARVGGVTLDLTNGEFDLLYLLASRAGEVLARRYLHERLLSTKYDEIDRAIDLRVSRLRQKLAGLRPDREHIKSVRGVGYLYVRG